MLQRRQRNPDRHNSRPNPNANRIDLAEIGDVDDNADRRRDIADLTQIGWAADLPEAEEHQEHDGGDGELQGDQYEDRTEETLRCER